MRRSYRSLLAALLILSACDSPSGPDGGSSPARLEVVSGDLPASVVVGTEVPAALVVRVLNADGKPLRGQIVNFRVTSGGGSVFAGAAETDKNGEARERWTLGTVAGDTQRVEARAVDPETGAAQVFAIFRAVGAPDAPATVVPAAPQRTGAVGRALADSLEVRVADRYNNSVPNVAVNWSVKRGGGSVSPAQSRTGANGVTRAQWVLGARADSSQAVTAAVSATIQAEFTAVASVAGAVTVSAVSGGGQQARVMTSPAEPLKVVVRTADGRPVAGAPVRWMGAGLESAVVDTVTNANGEATARVTLGREARAYLVKAEVGTGASVEFTLIATPDAPASLTPWYSGTLGGAVSSLLDDSIGVVVRDQFGNVVPGASVNWTAASGGGSFAPATSVADSAGLAWTRWTLGATAGQQRARATVQGTSTAVEIAVNAGTELRVIAGDNILTFDGTLWEQPRVALYGPDGPIGEARVEWTVASGGGSVSPGASRTSLNNPGGTAAAEWTLGGTAGAHRLTARVGNLRATLTAQRPSALSLSRAGTPGGRVLDVGESGALVLDSAGSTYTLRLRTISGGEVAVLATGDSRLDGRVFDGGVLYMEPAAGGSFKLTEWRSASGARTVLGETTRGLLRDGGWAAWGTGTRVFRRNLRDRVTDSIADSQLSGLVDLSSTGQLVFTRASGGTSYVAWGMSGTVQVASGNARVRVAGDTAVYALDPSSLSQFTFYTRMLPSGEAQAFFRGRDGQRPLFSAMGSSVALREQGSHGVELSRLSVAGEVRRIGRRPSSSSVYGVTDQGLTRLGGAAFLVREGGTTWLVFLSHTSDVVQATEVPSDARLLERTGFLMLVAGGSVYTIG